MLSHESLSVSAMYQGVIKSDANEKKLASTERTAITVTKLPWEASFNESHKNLFSTGKPFEFARKNMVSFRP